MRIFMYAVIFSRIILGAFLDILYFPLWWYGRGAINAAEFSWQFFKLGNERLAPGLWLANLFVPMYGQYDWEGRIISFIMRLVQIVFRSIFLGFWGLVCSLMFLIWLSIPLVVGYGIFHSLSQFKIYG